MDLILLEKVLNLGDLGDRVKVKPGYGRNYLVPTGKAVPATELNIKQFEERRGELLKAAAERLGTAESRSAAMQGVSLDFMVNASAEGRLYGSIGPREISERLTELGYAAEKSEVIMGEGPIRHIGHYDVPLQLHADVEVLIAVNVDSEDVDPEAVRVARAAAEEESSGEVDAAAEELDLEEPDLEEAEANPVADDSELEPSEMAAEDDAAEPADDAGKEE